MRKKRRSERRLLDHVLSHAPKTIGLTLDSSGWAVIDQLLPRIAAISVSRAALMDIIASDPQKRWVVSQDGSRIRPVLGCPVAPPETLYCGVAGRLLKAIRVSGLNPGGREQARLFADEAMARAAGRQDGSPITLRVSSGEMYKAGFEFFRADNGVWLTDRVPLCFLWL
jgi:putative RNA 2'-phosphotransferase